MAKELPYFQFEPNEWENGNIQMLSREDKGLFIDLCSLYWSRLGNVPYKLAIQKLCGGNTNALQMLYDAKIIDVIDDNIFIKFLSIQLSKFEDKSDKNRQIALDAWEKRRKLKELNESNANALQTQSERNTIREDKIIEDKIIVKKEKVKKESASTLDWDKFLAFFNQTFNKRVTVFDTSIKNKYSARLKSGYTKENIIDAMITVSKDSFHVETNFKHIGLDFFARPDKLSKYSFKSEKKAVTNNYNGTL
jgi:hypothetical protein